MEGRGWLHGVADPEGYDHPAVPVEDTEVVVRDRCDFCFVDGTEWVIPARSFETPVPGSGSEGDWAACDDCATCILRNDWNGLLRRVLASWEERHGQPMDEPVVQALRVMYRQLRKNITGPPRRIGE